MTQFSILLFISLLVIIFLNCSVVTEARPAPLEDKDQEDPLNRNDKQEEPNNNTMEMTDNNHGPKEVLPLGNELRTYY